MGIFSKPKSSGPDPETVRLQNEQAQRIAEREKAITAQEEQLALNKEKKSKRDREVALAGRRGLGGVLTGGFEGFRLGDASNLS